MCNRLSLNINLLISILGNYNMLDCVCINLSNRSYVPGIIGLTFHNQKFEVYEVSDIGTIAVVISTPNEDEACKQVLTCTGINLE